MMKIYVRIGTVDMVGYYGREQHPTREMEGEFVRVTGLETIPDETPDDEDLSFQVFTGILVDANGDDVEGGEVELVDHEIESTDDVPILFSEMLA